MKKIAVIGMGYVGIPCAVLLADVDGFDVTGIQRRSKRSGWKIDVLNSGKCPFEGEEPGLAELIAKVVKKGTFRVVEDYAILSKMDVILIDVQTPTESGEHLPIYDSIIEVSEKTGKFLRKGMLVITESTVAPGTTQNIIQPILEKNSGLKAGKDFHLAFSYERVMPGHLIDFIVNMPRVVGGIDKKSEKLAVDIYKKIVKKPIYSTNILTAETAKTIENAYRDVNIAFMNEMALICESLGVDIYEIRELINARHDRHLHIPGAGVGGHCLPKDSWLLKYGLEAYGKYPVSTNLISLSRKINDSMPIHLIKLAEKALKENNISIENAKISILGVSYLENTDDVRNTPTYTIVKYLNLKRVKMIAHDPYVREFPEAPFTNNLDEAVKESDCILLVTRHKDYLNLSLKGLKKKMRNPIIIDGRNAFNKEEAESLGFTYKGIGKGR